ncbi:hypothetical protein B7R22_16330 [Subtercola boreus]|uniref:HTH hxlR-type domain-containing protein n=1 Tax=Subtercola boreus TaxID=120213 RepID=A0A3E0VRN7_9MICO|nr:helix-turn-helix domain-containing protein [Subtercola boreus]RFA12361.1 hypothetical protein B7R22_16330 [Subtercola boreus]
MDARPEGVVTGVWHDGAVPGPIVVGRPRECSIADALAVIGDRWSLLIVRELGFGVTRFTDIRSNTGAPREILTARLRKLEAEGVIIRTPYQQRPARFEYSLTDAGRQLGPVLQTLRGWGEAFA